MNLVGSRNVFGAAVAEGVRRLVYASSVAAYGFHRENPQPLTEDVPARGSREHYYSAQKAEVETLLADTLYGSATAAYVFRPCIVAGPGRAAAAGQPPLHADLRAPAGSGAVLCSRACRSSSRCCRTRACPSSWSTTTTSPPRSARPCWDAASRASTTSPGAGELTVKQLAEELGWYSIPVPELALDAVAEMVSRLGFLPAQAQWIAAFREPVIMSTAKARRVLGWRPKHSALETLRETVAAARTDSLIR